MVIFDSLLLPLLQVLGLCQNINFGEQGLDYRFSFILLNNSVMVVIVTLT